MKSYFFSLFVFICISFFNAAGQEDDILLTIGNQKITRGEFERIYKKNNSSTSYDNKSVEDYLQLFINFKLKVIEAEKLGYDTAKSFITELAGYRDQLAKPYFDDKEGEDEILQQAYYRSVNEIAASHILIRVNSDATPADTLVAYNKIMNIRNRILKGESFATVAKEVSEDPSAQKNNGYLGWFSAFQMIFPFENAAYNTKVGEISMPVRTSFGYHLIKVEKARHSPGKVWLAHILILGSEADSAARKDGQQKVNECYAKLLKGEDFGKLAAEYSDDKNTANRGGDLGWIRSGVIPENLEDKIFALKDSGAISEPMPTEYGWHIFKLLGKEPMESFEEMKPTLEKKVKAGNRHDQVEKMVIERLKKENGFKFYEENLQPIVNILNDAVYDGTWDPSVADEMTDPVISFKNKDYTQKDFAYYIAIEKSYKKGMTFNDIVNDRIQHFIDDKTIAYEKSMLDAKYPDFKNLMEEYHDGILLFNLTDDMVWSKAMKDTAGLKQFYEKNKNNYMWQERLSVSTYTYEDSSLTSKVIKAAKKSLKSVIPASKFQTSVCGNDSIVCVKVEDKKYEKDDLKNAGNIKWEKGFILQQKNNNKFKIIVVNGIVPPEPKKLDEAKGLITADYQTYLEAEWIKSLRNKYNIEVNQEVLNKIIQQ